MKENFIKKLQIFIKNVKNKLHYAITKMTAPEIIYNRTSSKKDYMGPETWLSCTKDTR